MSSPDLDVDAIEDYARDGVVCVRGVLDSEQLDLAARGIERVLAEPGPLAQVASAGDDPGRFFEDFCRWPEIAELADLALHSTVPEISAALLRTNQVRLYHDHVLVKEGGTRQRTPWHQDQPYYNVDGRGISAWIPVDPVPEGPDPGDSGRFTPRTVADAEDLPGGRGEVVSRRVTGRTARRRGRPGPFRHP